MNRCENCQHWDRIGLSPIATCRRITESSEGAAMEIELSGYADTGWTETAFKTEADFGCTLHEPRDPQPAQPPSWKLI